LHSLSVLRGRLMADRVGLTPDKEPGAMLAVRASLEIVLQVLAEEKLNVVVANKNAPEQFVLSGSRAEIIRAEESFAHRVIESRRLPVSAAFHSSFVADVRQAFREGLEKVSFSSGAIPVFSNTTGREYPNQPSEVRELLARQLAEPVEFIDEIGAMYQAGIRVFVEVGPANKLSGLVTAILKDQEHQTLALDASSGKHPGAYDLARVLAQLAVLGHPIQLARWDETSAQRIKKKKPALTIPICGANYVKRESVPRGDAAMSRTRPLKTDRKRCFNPQMSALKRPPLRASTRRQPRPLRNLQESCERRKKICWLCRNWASRPPNCTGSSWRDRIELSKHFKPYFSNSNNWRQLS
jgi:acyl transferase domain-containing protein